MTSTHSQTLAGVLRRLEERGEAPALVMFDEDGLETWTYRQLHEQVWRLAAGLDDLDLAPGERVALLADNQPAWVVACLAILHRGGVVLPLDVQLDRENLGRILADSRPRLIFTDEQGSKRLDRLEQELPSRFHLDDGGPDGWQTLCRDEAVTPVEPAPEDTAVLFYTSGTTGPPKGVPLSHKNIAFQLQVLADSGVVQPTDRVLQPLPLHHVYPFAIGLLTPLYMGLPLIFPPALTGPQLAQALREGQVSLVIGVPRLYSALFNGIRSRASGFLASRLFEGLLSLSLALRRHTGLRAGKVLFAPLHRKMGPGLRLLVSGGSMLDPDLARRLEALGWRVATGYGLTETSPLLTINPPDSARFESVGRPIEGVEIKLGTVADDEDQESPGQTDRQEGELLVKGPNVFTGYQDLPDKTAESFTEDGWYRTGDRGYLDEDGYVYVTGRVSTLIITESGEKVQPDQVEEVLGARKGIQEAGVLQTEQRLVAVIVPDVQAMRRTGERAETLAREALEGAKGQLASYQRVQDYVLSREALPRTRLGKIRRHKLKEQYQRLKAGKEDQQGGAMDESEMDPEDRNLLADQRARAAWDLLAQRYSGRRLTPDTSPALDLGIDSLEWLDLSLELQSRTGVELDEAAIDEIDTVRDLLRAVSQGEASDRAAVDPLEDPQAVLEPEQRRWLQPAGGPTLAVAFVLYWLNRLLIRGVFRLRIQGREHLPEHGPLVIAPNHVSVLDPFVVAAALDFRHLRHCWWGGWTGMAFTNPLTRRFSRLAQVLPIDPRRGAVSSLAFGAIVLDRGDKLVWFPEGRRSRNGRLQDFKPGLGRLLGRYPARVVPVGIQGTHQAMPVGRHWPRLAPLRINFGKPLGPGEGYDQQQLMEALRERLDKFLQTGDDTDSD